ncbi:MAG: hypothetical protein ISS36_03330 [Candidatus Aenigmarchaeota archaeon]|nr:hypothetical protein [Candidatus Aenigmarchaeota archaeon]
MNDPKSKSKKLDVFIIIFSFASIIGTFFIELFGAESGFIVFAVIIGVVLIYTFFSFYKDMFKDKFQEIEENIKNISQINERLTVMEDKINSKKGAIDPRWFFIVILILLLIIYLRTVGLI